MQINIENKEKDLSREIPKKKRLEAINVNAGYKNKAILQGLNLKVYSGEIYALLGVNGAGKTTTLSLFLGFIQATSGQILVNNIDIISSRTQALKHIAYIPESVALYEHLTALENINYFLQLSGQQATPAEITNTLSQAGLQQEAINTRILGFSKGMRQKVVIALALIRKTPILLLDEPTSGLDPKATHDFHELLKILKHKNIAILMVTHDLLSAAEIADRIGFIKNGALSEEISVSNESEKFDITKLYQRYSNLANL